MKIEIGKSYRVIFDPEDLPNPALVNRWNGKIVKVLVDNGEEFEKYNTRFEVGVEYPSFCVGTRELIEVNVLNE